MRAVGLGCTSGRRPAGLGARWELVGHGRSTVGGIDFLFFQYPV